LLFLSQAKFAPHLEKCMGKNSRQSSRVQLRRQAQAAADAAIQRQVQAAQAAKAQQQAQIQSQLAAQQRAAQLAAQQRQQQAQHPQPAPQPAPQPKLADLKDSYWGNITFNDKNQPGYYLQGRTPDGGVGMNFTPYTFDEYSEVLNRHAKSNPNTDLSPYLNFQGKTVQIVKPPPAPPAPQPGPGQFIGYPQPGPGQILPVDPSYGINVGLDGMPIPQMVPAGGGMMGLAPVTPGPMFK